MSKARLRTLIEQIGGENRLEEILRDFYQRMSRDLLIGFFFSGKDTGNIARKQKEFMMFALNKDRPYTGKLPASAHLELPPILKGHFDRRITILREVLKDYGLSDKDIRTWVEFENAFKNVVVVK